MTYQSAREYYDDIAREYDGERRREGMSDEEDIDENWSLPPRPLRPLPQVAKLTEERDRLRAMLVKACVEIARFSIDWRTDESVRVYLDSIERDYGVRLRVNMVTRTVSEDTTNEPHQ